MKRFPSDKRHYSKLLPEGGVLCFDVGANVGRMAEVLLKLGHTVIAFEPQSDCIREIKGRCSAHKQHLQIRQIVLGDAPGEASLFIHEARNLSSLRPDWTGHVSGTIQAPVSTLDIAIQEFGLPHYCKIDVEGWELRVLLGLSQRIPLISFEYNQIDGKMEDAYGCLDRLHSLANIKVNITPDEQSELALEEWTDADEFNAVFQREFEGKAEFMYGDLYVRMSALTFAPSLSGGVPLRPY